MPMIAGLKEQSVLPEGQLNYQSDAGATPQAFGGGVAAGAAAASADTDQMATRDFAIKNETDRVAGENALLGQLSDLQFGNKDKGIVGLRNLDGQNAVDALPDYQQRMQDAYKDIRAGMNPAVARMFDFMGSRIMRGAQDSMGAYSSQQGHVALYNEQRANVTLSAKQAVDQADDPDPTKWDANIGKLQMASMAASNTLGLMPAAAEVRRQADVGVPYVERVKQLALRDPMAAASFYHSNIGMVPDNQRFELERMLGTMTDAQYLHHDGIDAYQSAIGQPTAPALPATVPGASSVTAYDQKTIDSRAAFIKSTTPWEAEINAAAKASNVNPAEIKLKIAMESMGDPKANTDGLHVGLGQFDAATAARYGVTDRTDPVQSINGIARMLAGNGGTIGGDPGKADRAYFGGNVNAQGPNTDQYVENARALRQAVIGGGAPAPLTAAQLEGKEGDVLKAAAATAEARRPGDSAWADRVAASAHAHWAQDVQALRGQDYANMSQVLDATVKTGATQMSDLPPDLQTVVSKLTPQNLASINAQFDRNQREADGAYTKSDPKLVFDTRQRIYLPDGDPDKITNAGQLTPLIAQGLNYTDTERLRKEITDANSPEGSTFAKQAQLVKTTARRMLLAGAGNADDVHGALSEAGAYRFGADLDAKIKAERTAKRDPTELFNPNSPNYVLDPARVMGYAPSESDVVATKARNIDLRKGNQGQTVSGTGSTPPAFASEAEAASAFNAGKIKPGDRINVGGKNGTWQAPKVANDADYEALAPGSVFIAPDGTTRRKLAPQRQPIPIAAGSS